MNISSLNDSPNQDLKTIKGNTRSGFTLIELLVVIAIIAILAAILVPVFGRARENARRTSCLSNLKQIGLGVLQYTQDYDEKFPISIWEGSSTNSTPGWAANIQPYLKSVQLYQCPSDPTESTGANPSGTGYVDYWYNSNLSWNGNTTTPDNDTAVSVAAAENPSLTVMVGEALSTNSRRRVNGCTSSNSFDDAFPAFTNCSGPGLVTIAGAGGVVKRHLDGINFNFADGHAKWYGTRISDTTNTAAIAGLPVYNPLTPFTGTGVVSGQSPTFRVS